MNQPENKTYLLALDQSQATMLWWCLWEKEQQLKSRIQQFEHTAWPAEAKNAAAWEAEQIRTTREKLESLGDKK